VRRRRPRVGRLLRPRLRSRPQPPLKQTRERGVGGLREMKKKLRIIKRTYPFKEWYVIQRLSIFGNWVDADERFSAAWCETLEKARKHLGVYDGSFPKEKVLEYHP